MWQALRSFVFIFVTMFTLFLFSLPLFMEKSIVMADSGSREDPVLD